jgi:hypothetical protein
VRVAGRKPGNPSLPLPTAPVAAGALCHGAYKTKQWRSPVLESEQCRVDEFFPSVIYLTPPDRFLNDAAERGRIGCHLGNAG